MPQGIRRLAHESTTDTKVLIFAATCSVGPSASGMECAQQCTSHPTASPRRRDASMVLRGPPGWAGEAAKALEPLGMMRKGQGLFRNGQGLAKGSTSQHRTGTQHIMLCSGSPRQNQNTAYYAVFRFCAGKWTLWPWNLPEEQIHNKEYIYISIYIYIYIYMCIYS